jgi:hypothetical protein
MLNSHVVNANPARPSGAGFASFDLVSELLNLTFSSVHAPGKKRITRFYFEIQFTD